MSVAATLPAPRGFAFAPAHPLAWPLAIIGVFVLQAILVLTHEPWMDEWQALQIALSSPDLTTLLAALHYEGHPPVWYLILRGAALVLPAPWVLASVQLIIAFAMQALVLLRLHLPRIERLAIALSFTILIEMGSLSRSMSLGALLLIAAFTLHGKTARWLMIALLPMADFQFGLLSMIAIVLAWRDRALSAPGIALWLVSGTLAALSVWPAADMVAANVPKDHAVEAILALMGLSPQLIPVRFVEGMAVWGGCVPLPFGPIVGGLFILLGYRLLAHARWEVICFLAFTIATLLLATFVYRLGVRHFTLTALLLILLRARVGAHDRQDILLWRAWLVSCAIGGLIGTYLSLVQPFDAGARAATMIASHHLDDQDIVAWPEVSLQGTGVRLGREFTSLTRGCTEGYRHWTAAERIEEKADLSRALTNYARRNGHFYFVSEYNFDLGFVPLHIKRIGHVKRGYSGYSYHLYDVAWDKPRRTPLPGPCGPARLPLAQWWGTSGQQF